MNTMKKMLEVWGDGQVVIHLDLVTGNYIEGLVKEIDRDEVVLEPIYEDGSAGPLTVIGLHHVVMAYYDDNPPMTPEETGDEVAQDAVASAAAEASPDAPTGP